MSVYEYAYDDKGFLVEQWGYDFDGTTFRYTYEYNSENRVEAIVCENITANFPTYNYSFDENGMKTKDVVTEASGEQTVTDYTYDSRGNLIKEIVTYADGTQRITCSKYAPVYVPYDLAEDVKAFVLDANGVTFSED